jgi:transcription initiation factor TFIIH subunit 2
MEEDGKEYRWETGYEKTWESITEDGDGMLDVSVQEVIHKARRKRLAERQSKAKLGMMRHLYLLIGDGWRLNRLRNHLPRHERLHAE